MKSLVWGAVVALALAGVERDASAGVTDEPLRAVSSGGAAHGMTLAKAKKRKRPAGGGAKSDPAEDAAPEEDTAGKSAPATSDASDDAKEEEIFGSKKKKAAPAAESDESGGSKAVPPKASPKSVETVESKASEEESSAPSAGSALEFGVGMKALFRHFGWTADGRAAGLGPYSLSPGPETGLWLEFYPAAFGTSGFAANIGIIGRFDYGFGVATTLANNNVVATKFRDFLAGIKVRIPLGTFNPNVSIAYGQQLFEIAPQGTPMDLPQLAYQFIRPALGARMMFTPTVALDLSAGYLMVLDPGSGANHVKAPNFFPKATSFGFDVTASIAFRLTGSIGLRSGVDLRAYTLDMNPDSTTRSVGGAVDRYITVWAGAEVVLDGQGAAAGGDDEPAKPSKRKRRRAAEKSEDDESEDESEAE